MQNLQERAPPRGVAIATIATLLETCSTSHPLSLKPPPLATKIPQQNAIRADKSTNTNIVADELCQQIENGFARISITDDCDKIDEKNNLCVPQMQTKTVKNSPNQNPYSQQQNTCNDLAFQNLRLQCMCSSGGIGDEDKFHGNNAMVASAVEQVNAAMCCTCSCTSTQNSVRDKYSRLIIDSGSGGGSDGCGGGGGDGKCGTEDQQHNKPPLLPPSIAVENDQFNRTVCVNCVNNRRETFDDETRTNLCKQQHRCNINLTEIKQCDDSLKATNNQLAMVHLNNLSHNNVYSHIGGAPQQLDSLTKEPTTEPAPVTNAVNTTCDDFSNNAIPSSNLHSSCSLSDSNQKPSHNPSKMGKNVLNLAESIEMSDDGVPMTPSPTISNISCSLNVASGSSSAAAAVTVGCEEKIASASTGSTSSSSEPIPCVQSPLSAHFHQNQTKQTEIDRNLLTQNDSGSCNSATTTTVTSSSSTISSATTPIPSQASDDNGGVNAAKRKKTPETKLVLDLNDRSKYTKEVSV